MRMAAATFPAKPTNEIMLGVTPRRPTSRPMRSAIPWGMRCGRMFTLGIGNFGFWILDFGLGGAAHGSGGGAASARFLTVAVRTDGRRCVRRLASAGALALFNFLGDALREDVHSRHWGFWILDGGERLAAREPQG